MSLFKFYSFFVFNLFLGYLLSLRSDNSGLFELNKGRKETKRN